MIEKRYCKILKKYYYNRRDFALCIHSSEPEFKCSSCKRKQPQRRALEKSPGTPQKKPTPKDKKKLLSDWLTQRKGNIPSFARIKDILKKEISAVRPNDSTLVIPEDYLYKQLEASTKIFCLELHFQIQVKDKIPPRVLQKCRRAFVNHRASFLKLQDRFPFVMQVGEIDRCYSYMIGILENVIADFGRTQVNRPLMNYIHALAKTYFEWTRKHAPSTRGSSFSKLVSYCLESLGLDKIWPSNEETGEETLEEVIGEVIKGLPKYDGKRLV